MIRSGGNFCYCFPNLRTACLPLVASSLFSRLHSTPLTAGFCTVDAISRGLPRPEHLGATLQTLLIVDDSSDSRIALSQLLADEYRVLLASDGPEGVGMALLHRPDLILLDVLMPGLNGYDVLTILKAEPETAAIPVIFVTGIDRPEDEARGLMLGGSDFITKPLVPATVRARVALHLRLTRQLDLVGQLARIDSLTGISNRRHFDESLATEFSRAGRTNSPLSVALVDVDFFKHYNDCYGHSAGDRALHAVAQILSGRMRRPGDLAARYGGEEFACVLPGADRASALTVAQDLCTAVASLQIRHCCSSAAPYITVSVGVASFLEDDEQEEGISSLIERADKCLYEAKARGRNRAIAEPTL
jgi:diguanylate cyclase (GGDEF)-like protein